MKKRDSKLIAIIGHNNTGKTVTACEIIKYFNDLRKDKKGYPPNYYKLITYDVQNRFTELKQEGDIEVQLGNKDWAKELLNYRCSLIVLDDYRALMPSDTLGSDVLNLMQYRSEYGLDIVLITHSPALLLQRLTYYIDRYFLFYTQGTDAGFKDKIPNYKELIYLRDEINNYVRVNGRGTYPNFPFIYYDSNNPNEAIKFNQLK